MKALRRQTLAKAIQLSLLVAVPGLAAAQETEATRQLDTVSVTGTRIKKADVESQVPVQVLSREDIDRSGFTSLGDIVQNLTASGSSLNTKSNRSGNAGFSPNGDGVGAGSAQVDLRHLGAKRVLVLVDGMRWVNESSASGVGASTDLNTIPLAIVERIEVLEDGASSLYGSDAIAGVVNIITRRNFEGAQVTLNYGEYDKGDGAQKGVDVGWGTSTDRSNLFVGASYYEQDPVFSSSRRQSFYPTPGVEGGGSSATPFGRFIFVDPRSGEVLDITPNAGATDPTYDPAQTGCTRTDDYHCFAFGDRFNFARYNMLLTPSKRTGVFARYRFDIAPNLQAYAKVLVNRRESVNQAAPEPLFLGSDAGVGNPYAEGDLFIPANHPYNPFGIDLDGSDNLILIGRRPIEGGPRRFEQEVNTHYVGAGLNGAFGADLNWSWDVNAAWSRNKADQTNYGSYDIYKVNQALGPGFYDTNGRWQCGTPSNVIAGCVPLNLFGGPGTITPEMLAWIRPVVHDRSEQTLAVFNANITGDIFRTWAGPVGFAAGYEYRRYEGSYTPDPLNYVREADGVVRNHYNGVPSLPTSGSYNVSEVYAELSIPLLRDATFAKALDLSLAGRYSNYSTFGGQFTPKFGVRWQLADELLMRATYSEGFRAPSIGELYGSASRADLTMQDPCLRGPQGEPPTGNAANCAQLGVPANALPQTNPQISVVTGGNPDLDPERVHSFSAGMVYSPAWATGVHWSDKLDIEVGFYRHSLEGAIQAVSAQTQLEQCVATLDPLYCNGITRTQTGAISSFQNKLTNLGSIKTDGWDINVGWTLPKTAAGQLRIDWKSTFVGRYEAVGAAGQQQPEGPGLVVGDPTTAIPEWTTNVNAGWKLDNWSASWTVRYISAMKESCGDATNSYYCEPDGTNTLDATYYNDVQVGYRFDWLKGLQLTAGVNNVFDQDPPVCLSCSLNGYDATTYDIPGGRFWYVRADLRF